MRKVDNAVMNTSAQPTSLRDNRWDPASAPSTRENSRLVTSRGWTNTRLPTPSASTWSANPLTSTAMPTHQMGWRARCQSSAIRKDVSGGAADAWRCSMTLEHA